ncbi:CD63 antigen-like [Amphiura filiformis]|uniref:CD63 antigen-like n=1 Tax=Amphiura filiformis TaxID=82378 RepID=UPI003B21C48D
MVAGCGAKCAKFLLFAANFAVFVVGVILIATGASALAQADKYSYMFGDENTLQAAAGMTIGVGIIIFMVGFTGCCGACKQSVCLLKIYFALILLVIVLEIIAAILAFVYKDTVTEVARTQMEKAIATDYTGVENNVATESIDRVQEEFMCCGADSIADWSNSSWAKNESLAAPPSCCMDPTVAMCNKGQPGMPTDNTGMYTEGCIDTFTDWVKGNYLKIGGVSIGLLLIEILALILTCCLIKAVEGEGE